MFHFWARSLTFALCVWLLIASSCSYTGVDLYRVLGKNIGMLGSNQVRFCRWQRCPIQTWSHNLFHFDFFRLRPGIKRLHLVWATRRYPICSDPSGIHREIVWFVVELLVSACFFLTLRSSQRYNIQQQTTIKVTSTHATINRVKQWQQEQHQQLVWLLGLMSLFVSFFVERWRVTRNLTQQSSRQSNKTTNNRNKKKQHTQQSSGWGVFFFSFSYFRYVETDADLLFVVVIVVILYNIQQQSSGGTKQHNNKQQQ